MNSTGYITKAAGFTLVELLVVIMIIVLLVGMVAPTLVAARTAILGNKSKATLAMLCTGCDYYERDHGMYPPSGGTYGPINPRVPSGYTGSQWVAKCLTGYLPENKDGQEGYGFRLREKGTKYGPYPPGVEKLLTGSTSGNKVFKDAFGNVFLYYSFDRSAGAYRNDDNVIDPINVQAPADADAYVKKADGAYYRRTYVFMSAGADEVFVDVKADPRTDDMTNFLRR